MSEIIELKQAINHLYKEAQEAMLMLDYKRNYVVVNKLQKALIDTRTSVHHLCWFCGEPAKDGFHLSCAHSNNDKRIEREGDV